MAEGAAGAEPTGERATVAKPKAFAPWMQGQARREVEMPPRKGKDVRAEALPQGERDALLRKGPTEDEHIPQALLRESRPERKGRVRARDATREPQRGQKRARYVATKGPERGSPGQLGFWREVDEEANSQVEKTC